MSVKDRLRRNAVKRIAVSRKKELTQDIFPLAYHAPFPELPLPPALTIFLLRFNGPCLTIIFRIEG